MDQKEASKLMIKRMKDNSEFMKKIYEAAFEFLKRAAKDYKKKQKDKEPTTDDEQGSTSTH